MHRIHRSQGQAHLRTRLHRHRLDRHRHRDRQSGADARKPGPALRAAAAEFAYDGVPGGVATRPEKLCRLGIHHRQARPRRHGANAGTTWKPGRTRSWAMAMAWWSPSKRWPPAGQGNDWSWMERYYSERTGFIGLHKMNRYVRISPLPHPHREPIPARHRIWAGRRLAAARSRGPRGLVARWLRAEARVGRPNLDFTFRGGKLTGDLPERGAR